MSYFERIEQLGQMNIYDYLLLEELNINEVLELRPEVIIKRQERFYELETSNIHETATSVEGLLRLLLEDAKYNLH